MEGRPDAANESRFPSISANDSSPDWSKLTLTELRADITESSALFTH